jgi:hypothetical protein
MAYTPEDEAVLSAAINGSHRIAAIIADLPADHQQRAFDATEQSYRETVENLNYPEDAASAWVAAVMYSVRVQVEKIEQAGRNKQTDHPDSGIKPANGA